MKRRALLVVLAFATFATSVLAADVPSSAAKPSVLTNQTESRFRWNYKTLVGDYDRVGTRNSKWDKEARAALEGFARIRANPTGELALLIRGVSNSVEKAVSAGCTDPMVNYVHVRYVGRMRATTLQQEADLFQQAAEELLASDYHSLRKAYACYWTTEAFRRLSGSRTNLARTATTYRGWLGTNIIETAKDASVPGAEIYELCTMALDELEYMTGLYDGWFKFIEPHLLNHWPEDYRLYFIKGRVYRHYAWRARGYGYADSVSEQNFKLFNERLEVAAEALRRAWKLNSQDPKIPTEMIRVVRGLELGRDEMEKWFLRAMALDPANYTACQHKMFYLEPKWHGSEADMLAFGRECAASRKWKGRVPLILAEAHDALARYVPQENRDRYWKQPHVWKDIRSAYETYFSSPDAEQRWRHNYVRYAHWCGQWNVLYEQVPKMGWTNYPFFGGKEAFDQMARTAKEKSTKVAK